jgi:hypothetical protein
MPGTRLAPLELPNDEYVWHIQVMLAFDCFCNAFLAGWYHETLSSRAWRAFNNSKRFGKIFMPIIDTFFAWQKHPQGHCRAVFERDLEKARRVVLEKNLQPRNES